MTAASPRDDRRLAAGVFAVALLLFLATLSDNLSLTHDSPQYAGNVLGGRPELHPNHLLYEPFLVAVLRLAGLAGIAASTLVIEAAGAVAGAAALAAMLLILRLRFALPRRVALPAVAAAGFSFGIWYYSVAIEIYVFPLACLAWAFLLLTGPRAGAGAVAAAAALHSAAILLHQTSILFALVPVVVLLPRWRLLALYVALGAVLVGGAYVAAAAALGQAGSPAAFLTWLMGYGTQGKYWSPMGPKALVLAAIGLGRALVGAHFLFAVPAIRDRVEAAFPTNSLEDEAYLVRDLAGTEAHALLGLTLGWGLVLAAAAVLALLGLLRGRPGGGPLVPLLAWLLPYAAFFTAWDAANSDFWMVQVLILWMLLAIGLARRMRPGRAAGMLGALALGLLALNGLGSIHPAASAENDYYRVKVSRLTEGVPDGALLVLGDPWPDAFHLRLYAPKLEFVSLAEWRSRPVGELVAWLRDPGRDGRPVYLWPDILVPRSDSLASYGAGYRDHVAEFRRRLCGTTPPPDRPALAARRLDCIE